MRFTRYLAVIALLLAALAPLQAQTTATLAGTVTVGGTPMSGVIVTISSPNLIGTRTVNTDENGNYVFGALPPGRYTVKFEMQGLGSKSSTLDVGLSTSARADAELQAQATDTITVTATSPAVLETQEVQTNLSAKLIEDLPIARTLLGTVNLAPGVNANGPNGATTISGGFAFDSTYYVDGAVVNEVLRGQPQNLFIEDAIQETTVQTGAISAEFGRFTGGVVTAISKSGGNEFTGSLRDSLTNAAWTAQGELDEPRPADSIQSTWEATLGGRIIRDRLWFFTAGRLFDFDFQRFFGTTSAGESPIPFQYGDREERLEVKLTGQVTPKHTLIGSYFDIQRTQINNPFGTAYEASNLDAERDLPNSFYTINYNGILSNSFLIEALYAKQEFSFVGSGADAVASPERGTAVSFRALGTSNWGGYTNFCSGCSFPEERNNSNGKLKGSYFLSTRSVGTHNITFGYETFSDYLKSDNHQSASDFTLWTYDTPSRSADGTLLLSMSQGNGFFIFFPVLQSAQGNEFNTQSVFVNNKWDLNNKLSFNIGARYDRNHGEDNAGAVVADDDKFSPRLGVTYDVFANGRLRLNASYSDYASKIANGNVGDAASPAGQPSYLYWLYYGPDLINLPRDQFLDQAYAWFRSVGFTNNSDFLLGGGSAGIQTQIREKLQSPFVREFTLGAGTQLGANGFIRLDYQDRQWGNFYTNRADSTTGTAFDPLADALVDVNVIENSDDFERNYQAVIVQGAYRLFNRVNLGANYTWSELTGNVVGETIGAGPVVTNGRDFYPEVFNYANNNPVGFLAGDQTHKVRAWASYDLPTFIGNFNFSVLQRFDSGQPYSAVATIIPVQHARCTQCPAIPSYSVSLTTSNTANYFFSERGAFRTDDLSATDLALNYNFPIGRVQLFAQGELINAFNEQAATNVNTNVLTSRNAGCLQGSNGPTPGARCLGFNPFTETPVEGVHWQKGPSFGLPLLPTTGALIGGAGDFQLPRTYRVSLGVRF